jgi:hypothetical protein
MAQFLSSLGVCQMLAHTAEVLGAAAEEVETAVDDIVN